MRSAVLMFNVQINKRRTISMWGTAWLPWPATLDHIQDAMDGLAKVKNPGTETMETVLTGFAWTGPVA